MNKASLRSHFRSLRSELSLQRREEAKQRVVDELLSILQPFDIVLSFASTPEEINLWPLNAQLAHEKRLALPRLENGLIVPRKVSSVDEDLEISSLSIKEPSMRTCAALDLSMIDCILVPGLSFDSANHRLGFGRGHYDRFLSQIPQIPTFGVGYREQKVDALPAEPHDIALTKVYFF